MQKFFSTKTQAVSRWQMVGFKVVSDRPKQVSMKNKEGTTVLIMQIEGGQWHCIQIGSYV